LFLAGCRPVAACGVDLRGAPPDDPEMDITSPCTSVCTLDATGTRCTACKRTIDEIVAWPSLTATERARIMRLLADR